MYTYTGISCISYSLSWKILWFISFTVSMSVYTIIIAYIKMDIAYVPVTFSNRNISSTKKNYVQCLRVLSHFTYKKDFPSSVGWQSLSWSDLVFSSPICYITLYVFENNYKAIEEICGKSTCHGSFLRLAAVTGMWSKKQKKTRF